MFRGDEHLPHRRQLLVEARWSFSVDTATRAPVRSGSSVSIPIRRLRRPLFVVLLALSGTVTEQPGADGDDRGALTLQVHALSRRWFAGGVGTFENNESLGIELRSQVGGVIGRRFVNSNRAQLSVGAGSSSTTSKVLTRWRRRTSKAARRFERRTSPTMVRRPISPWALTIIRA